MTQPTKNDPIEPPGVTSADEPPRYGHSFYRAELIEVRCALCGHAGSYLDPDPDADLFDPPLPYFIGLDVAVRTLPDRYGWSRAHDLEPGHVPAYDQRWLCPTCTRDHHCDLNGHQTHPMAARRNRYGVLVGPHQRCTHCRSYLTHPTLTRPGPLRRIWLRLCVHFRRLHRDSTR
ncbi:hypothetical protein GT755_09775 [Herbidospora sp. NEAU-GS84]|uniref:Uncharacterized protein n=1 Tax=Herbidospora solisilvae TaxID=2696284 RepID=A0A7C9NGN3_9ACTN|nr:hypothetical protein [Herbidospora solisilvae]NAS21972.1 hypothetical protein [Herbidospora solisilvae]